LPRTDSPVSAVSKGTPKVIRSDELLALRITEPPPHSGESSGNATDKCSLSSKKEKAALAKSEWNSEWESQWKFPGAFRCSIEQLPGFAKSIAAGDHGADITIVDAIKDTSDAKAVAGFIRNTRLEGPVCVGLCLEFSALPPKGEPREILVEAFKQIPFSLTYSALRFQNGKACVTLNTAIAQKYPEFFLKMEMQ